MFKIKVYFEITLGFLDLEYCYCIFFILIIISVCVWYQQVFGSMWFYYNIDSVKERFGKLGKFLDGFDFLDYQYIVLLLNKIVFKCFYIVFILQLKESVFCRVYLKQSMENSVLFILKVK